MRYITDRATCGAREFSAKTGVARRVGWIEDREDGSSFIHPDRRRAEGAEARTERVIPVVILEPA
jgi:hypothetical protein